MILSPQIHGIVSAAADNNMTFVASGASVSPSVIRSGGVLPDWRVTESDGAEFFYTGDTFNHTKTATGDMTVELLNTIAIDANITRINIASNQVTSDVMLLRFAGFVNLESIRINDNQMTGNVSGAKFYPALTDMRLNNNLLSGDVGSWLIPVNVSGMRLNGNQLSGSPDFSINTKIGIYNYADNALSQADVDAVLLEIYNRRSAFLPDFPPQALIIDGTNSTPSGVYQDAAPPTTGKEFAFKLENDPDGEGFDVWAITFTP